MMAIPTTIAIMALVGRTVAENPRIKPAKMPNLFVPQLTHLHRKYMPHVIAQVLTP